MCTPFPTPNNPINPTPINPTPINPLPTNTFFNVEWNKVNNLKSYLKSNGFWVFSHEVENPTNMDDNDVYKRIKITNEGLHITRFKSDKDYTNTNLNPRFELRYEKQRIPGSKRFKIGFKYKFIQHNPHAFFQLWARPINQPVQLTTSSNGISYKNHKGTYNTGIPLLMNEWYTFEVLVDQSKLNVECRLKDKSYKYSVDYSYWSDYKWIQSGSYGNKNPNQDIIIVQEYLYIDLI
jgi:hypothetical protein